MSYTITKANILDWARDYRGPKFHALLCDPPYHMTEMHKRFSSPTAAPPQHGTDGAFARQARGFMGKQWDGGDVAFRPETWAALAEHLYPGAFGMAFASSRGWHRMAVAIEDAGLIIHPSMFGWSYGSGFPKATRIDVQLDRRAGAERQIVGTRKHAPKFDAAGHGYREKDNGYNSRDRQTFDVTAPATELAADWTGHRYGLQAIKPSLEPIIVFQKPYQGRPVDCIAETGAGALWIDGGRIGTDGEDISRSFGYGGIGSAQLNAIPHGTRNENHPAGRWPANLILQHSRRCDAGGCAEDCAVRALGAQSGETGVSGAARNGRPATNGTPGEGWGNIGKGGNGALHADTGTAARYFYAADWTLDRLEDADPVYYAAKASRSEREAGLDPRTIAMMRLIDDSDEEEEIGEVDPDNRVYQQRAIKTRRCNVCGTRANNGKGGTRCEHNDWTWVPQYAYSDDFPETTIDDGRAKSIDNAYQRGETKRRNPHPTVKPLSLARYLATLLLPPARYGPRRLLVPFAGVASEVCGGMLAGWEEVQGVELDEEDIHIPVANARIRYWLQRRAELSDPSKPITVRAPRKQPAGQLDMFAAEERPQVEAAEAKADEGHVVYSGDRHTIVRCPEHGEPRDPATRKVSYKCGCVVKRRAQHAA